MFGQKFFNCFNVLMIKKGHLSFGQRVYTFLKGPSVTHTLGHPQDKRTKGQKSHFTHKSPYIQARFVQSPSFLQ
jgi:hypothetical protein